MASPLVLCPTQRLHWGPAVTGTLTSLCVPGAPDLHISPRGELSPLPSEKGHQGRGWAQPGPRPSSNSGAGSGPVMIPQTAGRSPLGRVHPQGLPPLRSPALLVCSRRPPTEPGRPLTCRLPPLCAAPCTWSPDSHSLLPSPCPWALLGLTPGGCIAAVQPPALIGPDRAFPARWGGGGRCKGTSVSAPPTPLK